MLTYLLLRALFLDTLHDEVASYMFYFYQGDYIGETIQWDANNHLLNSFIGHQLYLLFGDQFFVFRLPNVLAFILYFFGTVQLLKMLRGRWVKITGLLALNTIPFIMEYFANARGYGISLGFFVWSLVLLIRYFQTERLRSLAFGYLCLVLAVSANLTFVVSALMIFVIALVFPRTQKEKRGTKERITTGVVHGLFLLALMPFIAFSFALKKAGALYYGSLDGIWDVTGKTLSRYVLFYDADWLQYALLALFVLLILGIVKMLKPLTHSAWLKQPVVVFSVLFFGNIIGALFLATFLKVNYPEDRTGMYLVLLLLLILVHLIDSFPSVRWSQVALLFFPVSLAMHLSLDTSVFSPDDRFNKAFYTKIKSHIEPHHSIMIYHIMNWNWPYLESHSNQKSSVAQFDNSNTTLTDFLITKTTMLNNPEIPKLYDTLATHPKSTYIAFKRKQPLEKIALDTTPPVHLSGNFEYFDIATIPLEGAMNKHLQISVSGHLKTRKTHNKIQLVLQSSNKDGTTGRYYYYSFETTYQSQIIDASFLHHFILEKITPEENEIKVYLWNRGLDDVVLENASCELLELKTPNNESR